uniref:gamma-glutamylcyclotransferase n=1 Tax=Scleropages formosus TaxID=113540 RepID=A0A8C9TF38_SCLFO
MSSEGHFLYFAFGSNLLRERLRLLNPSAEYHCTAKLQDYSLRFGHWGAQWNSRWHGGVATIEELKEAHVWGVVWKISNDDLPSLDEQEGVPSGIYRPLEVSVETEGGQLRCRTYQLKTFECSLPSPPYKKVRAKMMWPRHISLVLMTGVPPHRTYATYNSHPIHLLMSSPLHT